MHGVFGVIVCFLIPINQWLMIITVKEISKNFIAVRSGTVIPSPASLPGLPTCVSLISDSLPVYTGQRGLEPEWLCMDKISYLWEGGRGVWGGVDLLEVWSTWKYLYFLHLLSHDLQHLHYSFAKFSRRGAPNLQHVHSMLWRVFSKTRRVCVFSSGGKHCSSFGVTAPYGAYVWAQRHVLIMNLIFLYAEVLSCHGAVSQTGGSKVTQATPLSCISMFYFLSLMFLQIKRRSSGEKGVIFFFPCAF